MNWLVQLLKSEENWKPWAIAAGAILRRFATIAGSALLTYCSDNWITWLHSAINTNEKIAIYWGVIYIAIEFVQKAIRESKKQKIGTAT